jgi:uncharacterized protein (DUF1684 family)
MGINTPRNSFLIIVGVGIIFGFILLLQFLDPGIEEYILQLQKDRKAKDEWFRTNPDSPLDEANRAAFKGLHYYDIDPSWKVIATLEPSTEYQRYEMPRTNGAAEVYIIAGKLHFKKDGVEHVLTAYQPNNNDSKQLFVPFRDLTSGNETYGGGRYLDVRLLKDKVTLDFNLAYNPYCVFDMKMVCPIPPAENKLAVAVTAGEKTYDIVMPKPAGL